MIRNQWYAILSSKDVKKNRLTGVTRMGQKMALWRNKKGEPCCIADKCCHRGASLSCGALHGDKAACPFHGFEYDASGNVTFIPANGKSSAVPGNFKVTGYTVREAYGFIWLWYGDPVNQLPEIPFFEELKNGFSYGEFSENWNVHYSRAIENQLDVVHLPFVHKTTIGRGNKALVNGPVVRWNGTLMTFYVKNRKDSGQKPEKPAEIADYEKLFSLQMQMPNLWQNRISPKLRIMAAFAPVDEENTRIYLRFYHSFLRTPLLGALMNALGNTANRTVLHQDRRVVLTQLPKKSELNCGENLVQGDLPVIEYRRMRQTLKDKNN
jgi:phenylpropionate dioxygenase-like ring-hydroxylating dioxygenase large terminal subunit